MDTSDPDIFFDERGFCNHCSAYFEKISKQTYQGASSDKQLANILKHIKASGRRNEYDCVIGISGGIDSCYVAYMCRKLGLRPLAVHMDNGWNSEEAVSNIKKVCSKLEIEYYSYVLDWEEFKDIQLAVLKSSIVEVEIPTDIAILGALHRVAAEHNIRFIISGGNYVTEGILPDSWFYNPKDWTLLKAIHKQFGTRKIRTFPHFDYKLEACYKFIKGIRMIYLLNYLPYSKSKAMDVLKNELGWKYYGGKHYESKFTGFVQSYFQPVKFNVDYRRATLATQICTGETTREVALEELKKPSFDSTKIESEKSYVCKKLGVSAAEFEAILCLPRKSYKDYPNDSGKLKIIYGIYRKLFQRRA